MNQEEKQNKRPFAEVPYLSFAGPEDEIEEKNSPAGGDQNLNESESAPDVHTQALRSIKEDERKKLKKTVDTLTERGFFVSDMVFSSGLAEQIRTPILDWPSRTDDAINLNHLLREARNFRVSLSETNPEQATLPNLEPVEKALESAFEVIGSLTDAQFGEFLYSDYFQQQQVFQRLLGELVDQSLIPREDHDNVGKPERIADRLNGRLRNLFSQPNSNLGANSAIHEYLPEFDLQPLDHMLWVVANVLLDDTPLSNQEKGIIRAVALLHDLEKAVMSKGPFHPDIGATIARSLLLHLHSQMPVDYPLDQVDAICRFISIHHLVERVFTPASDGQQQLFTTVATDKRTDLFGKDLLERMQSTQNQAMGDFQIGRRHEVNDLDHVKESASLLNLLQLFELIAHTNKLQTTQITITSIREWVRGQSVISKNQLIGMIRMVEADLVTTDKNPDLIQGRLDQLKILERGLLALSEVGVAEGR